MARVLRGTLVLYVALGLSSIAWGQQQQRQQSKDSTALGPFLSSPDVQKELKLNDEQVGKLKDAIGKVMDKYKADMTNFARLAPDELQKKMKSFAEDTNKAVASVLDAKQWKRFKQIQWQTSGDWALQDSDLQKELKLSDEQKKKVNGIFNDAQKKTQDLIKSRETSQEKYKDVYVDAGKKANEILSEEQQKNLKELKGAPFHVAPPKVAPSKNGK